MDSIVVVYVELLYNVEMARRWTKEEEAILRKELLGLYVDEKKTIFEIGDILGIRWQTVFDRMRRLGIETDKTRKINFKRRDDIVIPSRSEHLAEFFGIMLGDGHLSYYQVTVTLGTKELEYARYVEQLFHTLFKVPVKLIVNRKGHKVVYFGSRRVVEWLLKEGLVNSKVKSQVGVPAWIYSQKSFMRKFLKGFFDTDGSIYRLRFGLQISFTNYSFPILEGLQKALQALNYKTSKLTGVNVKRLYLTKRDDIKRFFCEIQPANPKHKRRFREFEKQWVGSPVGRGDRL